jgi:two-component system response regulator QseB
MKLLVVEDHESLGDMIAAHMREHGFAVDRLRFGADAFAAIAATRYDAMILDLGLPDIDGMDVLRRLRNTAAPLLPILILTARDRVDQRIAGLDAGADDYVLKPFDGGPLLFGDVSYDAANCAARVGTQNLELARREAALLEALIRNGEQIVIRDTLIERLYGIETDVSGNAIEATVSRLRRKLHALGSNVHIEVVRGIGYRLRQRASGA